MYSGCAVKRRFGLSGALLLILMELFQRQTANLDEFLLQLCFLLSSL